MVGRAVPTGWRKVAASGPEMMLLSASNRAETLLTNRLIQSGQKHCVSVSQYELWGEGVGTIEPANIRPGWRDNRQ